MKALLSIKPEFAEKILSGEKRYEFRKACFSKNVQTVVIYATMPVGKIVGEFEVEKIIADAPVNLWEKTKEAAGISLDFFLSYFSGRDVGYAIKVKKTLRYKRPRDPYAAEPGFIPPQSFRYLTKKECQLRI